MQSDSQTPTYDTPATAGMLATARIPAATGTPIFIKGTSAGQGTTSTAKIPATAGSVWKSYKNGRKSIQKYGCECGQR